MSAQQIAEQWQRQVQDAYKSKEDYSLCYTTDAKVMLPGIPTAVGRNDLKAAFAKYAQEKNLPASAQGSVTVQEAYESGNLIVQTGEFKTTCDGRVIDSGRFLIVLKQEDAKWRACYEMSN